ncbi:unnamed protein product, partial [Brassica oleracea var. botrytis]
NETEKINVSRSRTLARVDSARVPSSRRSCNWLCYEQRRCSEHIES